MQGNQDVRPIPDPTVLTTAASLRLEEVLRTLIKTEMAHQHELFDEKFARIDSRFNMLEDRTAEQKSDTKAALDAALAAQKEAVASQTASFKENITKSETAAAERIKSVETLLATSSRAVDDKITDIKDRVIKMEAIKLGNVEQVTTQRAGSTEFRGTMAAIISIVTTVIAIASIVITIIVVTTHP